MNSIKSATNFSSFRKPFLDYIKEFAPPKISWKLMQICQYFYPKQLTFHPIKSLFYRNKSFYYSNEDVFADCYEIDVENKQLYLMGELELHYLPKITERLLNKIVVCDLKSLILLFQPISFDEFKFLTSSGLIYLLSLTKTTIKYSENNAAFPLEKIFQCTPNIVSFFYDLNNIAASCILPNFINNESNIFPSSLKYFKVDSIPEQFDYKMFSRFTQMYPKIDVGLTFNTNLSDEHINQLQTYVDNLIKKGLTKCHPPSITFPKQTPKSKNNLNRLRGKFYKRNKRKNFFNCFA